VAEAAVRVQLYSDILKGLVINLVLSRDAQSLAVIKIGALGRWKKAGTNFNERTVYNNR